MFHVVRPDSSLLQSSSDEESEQPVMFKGHLSIPSQGKFHNPSRGVQNKILAKYEEMLQGTTTSTTMLMSDSDEYGPLYHDYGHYAEQPDSSKLTNVKEYPYDRILATTRISPVEVQQSLKVSSMFCLDHDDPVDLMTPPSSPENVLQHRDEVLPAFSHFHLNSTNLTTTHDNLAPIAHGSILLSSSQDCLSFPHSHPTPSSQSPLQMAAAAPELPSMSSYIFTTSLDCLEEVTVGENKSGFAAKHRLDDTVASTDECFSNIESGGKWRVVQQPEAPRSDPKLSLLAEKEAKILELEEKIRQMEMKQSTLSNMMSEDRAKAQKEHADLRDELKLRAEKLDTKDRELEKVNMELQKKITLLKDAQGVNDAITLELQKQQKANEQHSLQDQITYKNELEILQSRFQDVVQERDKLTVQARDLVMELEKRRREAHAYQHERDEVRKQLEFQDKRNEVDRKALQENVPPPPAPSVVVESPLFSEQEYFAIQKERNELKKKLDETYRLKAAFPISQDTTESPSREEFLQLRRDFDLLKRETSFAQRKRIPSSDVDSNAPSSFHTNSYTTPERIKNAFTITNDPKSSESLAHVVKAPSSGNHSEFLVVSSRQPAASSENLQEMDIWRNGQQHGYPAGKLTLSSDNVRNLISTPKAPSDEAACPLSTRTSSSPVQLMTPFATDFLASEKMTIRKQDIEKQLLTHHMEKERLHNELTKLEEGGFKTIQSRKRKSEIDTALTQLHKDINKLKLMLRSMKM